MQTLTKRQKLMALAAAVLVISVAAVYLGPALKNVPTPGSLDAKEEYLRSRQSRLTKLERVRSEEQAELEQLRETCKSVLWEGGDRVLSTVLQNELQNIARRERATLRSVGSPRSREINDSIRGVEVSVRVQGDMKEIARFIARVDAARPRFFWTTCTMRPINLRDPDTLDFSGRIEALFAVGPAEQLIFGEETR